MKLYEMIDDQLVVNYQEFLDQQNIYSSGESDLREEAKTNLKILHYDILNAFSNSIIIFSSKLLYCEKDYKKFLNDNKDIFSGYIEVLVKHSSYSIDEENEE